MPEVESKKEHAIKEAIETELRSEEDEVSALKSYHIKQDAFEGPFDLLLHLIDDDKIDIYTVSLDQITKGYLEQLKLMEHLNIVMASEFLLMAAYLLELKSKKLLPREEKVEEGEESLEDLENTLLERLYEYKIYKGLAGKLKERKEIFNKAFSRYTLEIEALPDEDREVFLTDVTLRDLVCAFQKVWEVVESRGEVGEIVEENITVDERIKEIIEKIKINKGELPFEELFTRFTKLEVVVTFLAILELAKQKMIRIMQGESFGSILIVGKQNDRN